MKSSIYLEVGIPIEFFPGVLVMLDSMRFEVSSWGAGQSLDRICGVFGYFK